VREVGIETRVAVFDQHRELLDAETTVAGAVAPEGNDTVFPGGKPVHVAAYLAKFNFPAAHHRRPVRTLSGGERNRLALARFLLTPANLLLLDEPTNDLDLDTVRTLEEALVSFDGTVLVVSHDRMFLDRVATRLLVFEALPDGGRGTWLQPGGWATYRRLRGEALAAEREAARRCR
jgi:ATP-binding cassette subfamily F protein uup